MSTNYSEELMQVINWKYWCIRETIISLSHGKSVSCIS